MDKNNETKPNISAHSFINIGLVNVESEDEQDEENAFINESRETNAFLSFFKQLLRLFKR